MPTMANAAWRLLFPLYRKEIRWAGDEYGTDRKETFETIYRENRWNSTESRSGTGSTLDQTILLRRRLPAILSRLNARTLLDAPCGDYHWMKSVTLPDGVAYIGGEIVAALVADLDARHGRPGVRFIALDIVADPLPAADVWLCRDVLFHLSNADILATLRNFAESDISYILTTTYPFGVGNRDIRSGGFRYINLTEPPFSLPRPRRSIDDFLAPEAPRKLALWSREEVGSALQALPIA